VELEDVSVNSSHPKDKKTDKVKSEFLKNLEGLSEIIERYCI
jgi:hypothetical protein